MRTIGIFHGEGAELQKACGLAGDSHGVMRKLVCYNLKIHSLGFDAPLLHVHYRPLLGKISPASKGKLHSGVVPLAISQWHQHRMCLQCEMGRALLYRPGGPLHNRRSMEQIWRSEITKGSRSVRGLSPPADIVQVDFASHIVSRVVGLIIIPLLVYMFSFYIHFLVLENTGPGDAQMSSLFQANLKGTDVGKDSPLEIAYGSRATLKNMGYGGGLLHSHVQTYPEGSQQQQVTCYHHKDSNNDWFFYPNRSSEEYDAEAPIKFVADKDVVRLIHSQTGRNLHSHVVPAPVTKADHEVSCYGNTTIGDDKDHWTVEVVSDAASRDRSKIRTLATSFRLRHTVLGCYLRAANVNLPQWGFKQIEVSCVKQNSPRDVFTHWNVESHWNERCKSSISSRLILSDGKCKSACWGPGFLQVSLPAGFHSLERGDDDL